MDPQVLKEADQVLRHMVDRTEFPESLEDGLAYVAKTYGQAYADELAKHR